MRWLHKVSFGNRGRRLGIPVGVAAIWDEKRQRRKLRTTTTTAATDFAIVKILDMERECAQKTNTQYNTFSDTEICLKRLRLKCSTHYST